MSENPAGSSTIVHDGKKSNEAEIVLCRDKNPLRSFRRGWGSFEAGSWREPMNYRLFLQSRDSRRSGSIESRLRKGSSGGKEVRLESSKLRVS